MMKYVICLFLNIVLSVIPGFCTGDTYLSGDLDSIINIEVITDNQLKQDVPDIRLQSTPPNGSTVARIYCDNNNYNGFSLTFQSDRLGKLVFFKNNEFPANLNDGHFVNYTLDLIRGETGILGIDMPDSIERTNFDLQDSFEVFFNDNVLEATYDAEFILKMHVPKKLSLFHGEFRDTITVTIRDI